MSVDVDFTSVIVDILRRDLGPLGGRLVTTCHLRILRTRDQKSFGLQHLGRGLLCVAANANLKAATVTVIITDDDVLVLLSKFRDVFGGDND